MDEGVDDSLRLGADLLIFSRAVADVFDLSVRPQHAAVRGTLFDFSFAVTDVGDDARTRETGLESVGSPLDGSSRERGVEQFVSQPVRNQQFIGSEITPGRIVLMQAVHGDSLRRR